MQAAGDHQVKNQPKVIIQAKCDPLSDTTKLAHGLALHTFNRRLHGSQEKWAIQSYAFQRMANDPSLECADISGDVWQFGHYLTLCTLSAGSCNFPAA